ncbi:putative ABC transport system permease protein [Solimonas aquatica]|uniref:Putative ABC transport system permease protein n=1 Tax=Solimonas aquatica TaxID=489703 RepID=A0A1H9CWV9_9GAMM|nr:ABC transporter permease [Solimonas aquatica]SEQ05675.1 putative ABC transport system permease protein [Solimonas aquatica]
MLAGYVLRLAGKNMLRHRLRTGLTLAGIAIAIVSFGLLRTVVDSWYAGAELGAAGRLVTRNAASLSFSLPVTYAERIRRAPGVRAVTWASWFGGIYIDEKHFFSQLAVDASSYLNLYPEYLLSPEQSAAFQHDRRGAVVGRKLAAKYGFKIGDTVPLQGTLFPGNWSFVVRGIYRGADDKTDENQFLVHWDYVNETIKNTLPAQAERVGAFIVDIREPTQAAAVSAAIDSSFRNSLAETRTETQKAFQLGFIALVDTILLAIQTVAYVVVLIIMAVMANTMAMAARERTREYATLKALGFRDGFVAMLILGESLSLSLAGGALGILLTYPAANAFHSATRDLFLIFQVQPLTVLLQLAAALLIGVSAALAPMLSSRRVQIVDGLRAVT